MDGFCLLVELHQKGYAPSFCAAGLFIYIIENLFQCAYKKEDEKKVQLIYAIVLKLQSMKL